MAWPDLIEAAVRCGETELASERGLGRLAQRSGGAPAGPVCLPGRGPARSRPRRRAPLSPGHRSAGAAAADRLIGAGPACSRGVCGGKPVGRLLVELQIAWELFTEIVQIAERARRELGRHRRICQQIGAERPSYSPRRRRNHRAPGCGGARPRPGHCRGAVH